MKKLIKVFIVLVVLLVLAAVAGLFFIGHIVKAGVEKAGPLVTKTPVTLEGALVSILGGSGSLKGFVVGNPEGYKSAEAIKVGTVSLSLAPKSIFADKVVIRSIKVESPEITFEKAGLKGSNLEKILDNISGSEKESGNQPKEGGKSTGAAKKLQVDEFVITGAKVHAVLPIVGPLTAPLPEIKLTNLGQGPDGITAAELSKRVMSEVLAATIKAVTEKAGGLGKGVESLGTGAADQLKKGAGGVGDLFKKK